VPHIYPAGITEKRLAEMKEKGLADNIREDGHIVVRVYKGGKKYQIFVLNDRSVNYEIKAKSKVFTSRGNRK
jgi:ribosomal protein L25 (general stress protein Ctc)